MSRTQFEHLSNELIYEIFDYLDTIFLYQTFSKLNHRLTNLMPKKISFRLMKKNTFEEFYSKIFFDHRSNFVSFNVENFSLMNFTFDEQFSNLEFLRLCQIPSQRFRSLLNEFDRLTRLTSLVFHTTNYFADENFVFASILRLPTLKFCHLTFSKAEALLPLPFARPSTSKSNLERLIIDGPFRLEQFIAILTYTPKLRQFSSYKFFASNGDTSEMPSIDVNLKILELNFVRVDLDEIFSFLRHVGRTIEILRLGQIGDEHRWRNFRQESMPKLVEFGRLSRLKTIRQRSTIHLQILAPSNLRLLRGTFSHIETLELSIVPKHLDEIIEILQTFPRLCFVLFVNLPKGNSLLQQTRGGYSLWL